MYSIVFSSSNMHTHHYPTIVRWSDFVAACVVTCVVFCGLSVVSCARRLLCSSAASLAQSVYLDIRPGRQYTYSWAPVATGDDSRGRGPKKPPMPGAPTGRAGCCKAICTGVPTGSIRIWGVEREIKEEESKIGDMCKGKGSERLHDKEVFTRF